MTALNKPSGAGDVSQKTYYIHPAAFGGTKYPGHGHVPVVKADDFEKLRAKLESAEKRIEDEICRANREHHRCFMMACNHLKEHANVHYADAAEMEIAALRQRIAELEARAFKVEMPESFYPDGDIDAPLAVDELEVIAAIVEAGGKPVAFCKRCDREIDLTHRPDGSHYCHAPDAGIGVKGE